MNQLSIVPGLAGVVVTSSSISFVDGNQGILSYRGIPIEVLAEKSNYPEVAYLLINGALPDQKSLDHWNKLIANHRTLEPEMVKAITALPKEGHPMAALSASVLALGMQCATEDHTDSTFTARAAVKIIAKMPAMVAAFHRYRSGKRPLQPKEELDHAGNFLYMLHGKKPSDLERQILDTVWLLHADHELNASTFASRVCASTKADIFAVAATGINTLAGPLHGGANEAVLKQLLSIGSVKRVGAWVDEILAKKERIMGMGHRVYKVKDPRAIALQKLVPALFEAHGHSDLYEIALELEKATKMRLGEKGIYPNIDLFSGLIYEKLGIPADLFTPMFAVGRIPGWLAHWFEQMKNNQLYRPAQIYTGGQNQPYVPIASRPTPDNAIWQRVT